MIPGISMRRTASIAGKEVRHILRDPFTLGIAIGLPILFVAFFGWVMSLDPRNVPIAVADMDRSRPSRQLVETFSASGFFKVSAVPAAADLAQVLRSERAKAVLIVEPGFARALGRDGYARVQLLLDGADNSTAGVILGYLQGIQAYASERLVGPAPVPPLSLETRFLFNPELNSRWFIVPGLIVVVMAILAIMLTALTVAREWETGSMELLLSTPVKPAEIVLGKLAPYLALAVGAVVLVYLMARLTLGVPFKGSHIFLAVSCLMFLIPCLAQGLLISVTVRQQTLAMQLGLVSSILPSLLFSGFIFPIENMPLFFRIVTMVLPPRWFMVVIRGIFLKGAGPFEMAVPLLAMLVLGGVLVGASVRKFKSDLEP